MTVGDFLLPVLRRLSRRMGEKRVRRSVQVSSA